MRKQRKREKELEAALRDAHGFLSSTPHPLLLPEGSPFNPSAINSDNAADTGYTDPDMDGLLDSFGSLTIDNKGQTSYHGSSSTVEVSWILLEFYPMLMFHVFSICSELLYQ